MILHSLFLKPLATRAKMAITAKIGTRARVNVTLRERVFVQLRTPWPDRPRVAFNYGTVTPLHSAHEPEHPPILRSQVSQSTHSHPKKEPFFPFLIAVMIKPSIVLQLKHMFVQGRQHALIDMTGRRMKCGLHTDGYF